MEFPQQSPEWRPKNEVLERKKTIAAQLAYWLDVEGHIEKVIDQGDRMKLSAEGVNAHGDIVLLHFDMTINLHDDVHSFMIYAVPNHEEVERIIDYVPSGERREAMIGEMMDSGDPHKLYRLDKTMYDSGTGDPDAMDASGMAALFGKNNADRPADVDDFLASRYETDAEGRIVSYNDNYAETKINSERAAELLEGLTVKEVKMYIDGVLQDGTKRELKPKFLFPELESELGEIERVARMYDPEHIETFVQDFYGKAYCGGGLSELTEEVWGLLENTDSFTITKGNWAEVASLVDQINTGTGSRRSWQDIRSILERNGELDAPVIIKYKGKLHLVAGNTRLMVARAAGIRPKVLIVEM